MAKKLGFIALVATVGLLVGLGVRWVNHAVASTLAVEKSVTTSITSSASTDSMKVYLTGIDTSAVMQILPGISNPIQVDDWAVIIELKNKSKVVGASGNRATQEARLDSAKIDVKIQMSEDNRTWYPTTPTVSFSDSCTLGKDTTVVRTNYLASTAIPPNFKYVRFIIAGRDSGNSADIDDVSNDSTYIPRITLIGRSLYSNRVAAKTVPAYELVPSTADTHVVQLYKASGSLTEAHDSLQIVSLYKVADASSTNSQSCTVKYQVSRDGTTWVPTTAATANTISSSLTTEGNTGIYVASISRAQVPQTYRYIRLIATNAAADTLSLKHYVFALSLYPFKR